MSSPTVFLGHPVPAVDAIHPHGDVRLVGKHVTLAGMQPSHAAALHGAIGGPSNSSLFNYTGGEPALDLAEWQAEVSRRAASKDPTYFTVLLPGPGPAECVIDDATGQWVGGLVSLHHIDMANRSVEVGHVVYGRGLARSTAATELMYLLVRHVFEDLRFRRCEWKANALNKASARAATRLGFVHEGTFRQHQIVRGGLNRDTLWFSIIDGEWEVVKKGFEGWLSEDNFDEEGRQKKRLEEFRES